MHVWELLCQPRKNVRVTWDAKNKRVAVPPAARYVRRDGAEILKGAARPTIDNSNNAHVCYLYQPRCRQLISTVM